MKKILELAKKKGIQAEVYQSNMERKSINFSNGQIIDLKSSYSSDTGLRILKDGYIGKSKTTKVTDSEELLKSAIASLSGKVEAKFSFPKKNKSSIERVNNEISSLSISELVEKNREIDDYIATQCQATRIVSSSLINFENKLINSNGSEIILKNNLFLQTINLPFPNTGAGLSKISFSDKAKSFSNKEVDDVINFYKLGLNEVRFPKEKIEVLFMPGAYDFFHDRLQSATMGMNIYNGTSPLVNKLEKKIFSNNISIFQDTTLDNNLFGREFDDEGVLSRRLPIIENGVLKNYILNLNYAQKIGLESSGAAMRIMSDNPFACLSRIHYKTNEKTINEIVKSMKNGLLVHNVIGGQSGNILNGDYSVGVSCGFYVKNGTIIGRVKDLMISGNFYEDFNKIIEISREKLCVGPHTLPALLFNDLNVMSK